MFFGVVHQIINDKIEVFHKRCIRNLALKPYKAHTEPLFKNLCILKLSDKLSYCRSIFMHKFRNHKLPDSFLNIFTDITNTDELQTRDNDYNYIIKASIK